MFVFYLFFHVAIANVCVCGFSGAFAFVFLHVSLYTVLAFTCVSLCLWVCVYEHLCVFISLHDCIYFDIFGKCVFLYVCGHFVCAYVFVFMFCISVCLYVCIIC